MKLTPEQGPNPSPHPFPRLLRPNPSVCSQTGHCGMNEHHVHLEALPKIMASASPAFLGAPALGGSRYMGVEVGEGRGLVVLVTPKACPRAPGPALQNALSASSLTESPQGVSGTD